MKHDSGTPPAEVAETTPTCGGWGLRHGAHTTTTARRWSYVTLCLEVTVTVGVGVRAFCGRMTEDEGGGGDGEGRGAGAQMIQYPPSTRISEPVMNRDASLARNTIAPCTI